MLEHAVKIALQNAKSSNLVYMVIPHTNNTLSVRVYYAYVYDGREHYTALAYPDGRVSYKDRTLD
jgi:hypothetical protein